MSAHDQTSDKVFGLNCGADDYVTKPFDSAELKARVDSRLRSQSRAVQNVVHFLDLEFDSDFQRCSFVGLATPEKLNLNLTPTEFRILLALAKAEGKPLGRQGIVRAVWTANGMNIEKRGINSHIVHLRKKLEACPAVQISSVYGKGYALTKSNASAGN